MKYFFLVLAFFHTLALWVSIHWIWKGEFPVPRKSLTSKMVFVQFIVEAVVIYFSIYFFLEVAR